MRPTPYPLLLLAILATGCGAPQEREPGWDQMVFADEQELDDSAVEAIPPPIRLPARKPARVADAGPPGARPSGVPLQGVPVPPPRCDGDKEGPSRSLGPATDGALENGCKMPGSGPGWVQVNRNAWGTDQVVALLQMAAGQLARQYPGSVLVVGALSAETGGFLRPHKSHQSGRDVDLGYLHLTPGPRRFQKTDSGSLDGERTWALIETLLYTGQVAMIFMDYELQASLYQDLLAVGWSEDELAPIFQYPAPPHTPRGIIRHSAGHADHFHVRFRCAEGDRPDCAD